MEIRRTTQFLNFALGTRSPANPNFPKSTHYTDPKDAKLNFPKNKTPYYDPVSKTIKVPGKESSQSKQKSKSKTSTNNKNRKSKTKAITKDESEELNEIIKPKPVKN